MDTHRFPKWKKGPGAVWFWIKQVIVRNVLPPLGQMKDSNFCLSESSYHKLLHHGPLQGEHAIGLYCRRACFFAFFCHYTGFLLTSVCDCQQLLMSFALAGRTSGGKHLSPLPLYSSHELNEWESYLLFVPLRFPTTPTWLSESRAQTDLRYH